MSQLEYQFFPRSNEATHEILKIIKCFEDGYDSISSDTHDLVSNKVLELLRNSLEEIGFTVESGKSKEQKINVPVLFGKNNTIDKYFNADAVSNDGRIVIEVEAGRAWESNQYMKDIFEASMMFGVEFLVIAVRQSYRGHPDFERIYKFLETLYISSRIQLPLKGILLIGY